MAGIQPAPHEIHGLAGEFSERNALGRVNDAPDTGEVEQLIEELLHA